ncbi:MFS transporter permease [Microbacterium aurantiacum]|uniref:MFS transporter permease n=1 Tax=Microbacterium aurantiacum TaxID=162393 RepID=UPI0040354E0B
MMLRRAFFLWLLPAAFLLPLWLLIGWGVFNAGGWALLWVLVLAVPGVFVWQLVLIALIRARGTVRGHRAVSWWDVLGVGTWQALVVSLGFFRPEWWGLAFFLAVAVGVAVFWSSLWQLWREARPSGVLLRTREGVAFLPPTGQPAAETTAPDVIIVSEQREPPATGRF